MSALNRYLPALEGLGIVRCEPDGTYRVTPLGRLLRRDTGALHGQALMAGDEYYGAWQELDHCLLIGESAFHARHGRGLWEMAAGKPDLAAGLARAIRWNSARALSDVLALYDFTAARLVVDLGPGDAQGPGKVAGCPIPPEVHPPSGNSVPHLRMAGDHGRNWPLR
ncbi:hypothetical protein, partial [Micromonospora rubida]